jgi:hypothetical protein
VHDTAANQKRTTASLSISWLLLTANALGLPSTLCIHPIAVNGPQRMVLCVIYKTGIGLDDCVYCDLYIIHSGLQAIQRYRYSTHFPVRRYRRTMILRLH